jgi:hypothetical protein
MDMSISQPFYKSEHFWLLVLSPSYRNIESVEHPPAFATLGFKWRFSSILAYLRILWPSLPSCLPAMHQQGKIEATIYNPVPGSAQGAWHSFCIKIA